MKYNFLVLNACEIGMYILKVNMQNMFPNSIITQYTAKNKYDEDDIKLSTFDLIIIDTNFICSKADLQSIRDKGYKKGLIAMTSYADYNSIEKLKSYGVDEIMVRPFKYKLLGDLVGKYCHKSNYLACNYSY